MKRVKRAPPFSVLEDNPSARMYKAAQFFDLPWSFITTHMRRVLLILLWIRESNREAWETAQKTTTDSCSLSWVHLVRQPPVAHPSAHYTYRHFLPVFWATQLFSYVPPGFESPFRSPNGFPDGLLLHDMRTGLSHSRNTSPRRQVPLSEIWLQQHSLFNDWTSQVGTGPANHSFYYLFSCSYRTEEHWCTFNRSIRSPANTTRSMCCGILHNKQATAILLHETPWTHC